MTNEYEPIYGKKSAPDFLFFVSDFSPEESNKIITNLVNKIEEYEKAREIKTEYETKVDNKGKTRIINAKIKSLDEVIVGEVKYSPIMGSFSIIGFSHPSKVSAKFSFNSNNLNDMQEYLGLVKIIKGK